MAIGHTIVSANHVTMLPIMWLSQDEEVVQLPPDPTTGSVDLLDFDNPADLMVELLKQCGGSASVSKLTKVQQYMYK